MSELPKDLKYATSHEWVKVEEGNIVQVGITDFAQQQLGDLVYIELPKLGRKVTIREQCAIVESVKTASDLFSPVAGEIIAINEEAADEPEQVNDKPYQTWLFRIQADDLTDLDHLLDADAYQQLIDQ
ncbi:MAG: glycine cleavage system protein GcvH [Methylococcales bacterium]|nr:glycine cleavage system protein GcvH [Methylococcales bacterium]